MKKPRIVKIIIESILTTIMRIVFIVDLRIREKINIYFRVYLYSLWIQNFFGEVGEKTRFIYPVRLNREGAKRIKIGSRSLIQRNAILEAVEKYRGENFEPEIIIGNDCSLGEFTHLTAINRITIGNGLLTGRFVYIGDNAHGGLSIEESTIPPADRKLKSKGEIIIGNNVWIGDKVTILGGVTIGDNVIIGANSVVTHDIPCNCIATGMPSKVIKEMRSN